jgi:hypothetical protein
MSLTIFRVVTLRVQGEKRKRGAKPHTWVALIAAPSMAALLKHIADDITDEGLRIESINDCGPLLSIIDRNGNSVPNLAQP